MSSSQELHAELALIRRRLDCLTDLRLEGQPSREERQEWARLARREVELLNSLKGR